MSDGTFTSEKDLFAEIYYGPHNDIYDCLYREYWFKGGRGSLKSSFCSLELVIGIMNNQNVHACVLRKTASTCRGSVFKQIEWAINKLGVSAYWQKNLTELKWTYIPTKQEIIFRGLDDPEKLKSLKQPFGYYRYLWFEELTEFDSMEEVRNVMQTILRGGDKFQCFMSYNPPSSPSNWVNMEAKKHVDGRMVYASCYLDVPREWLGDEFFEIAEALKESDERAYKHEYLGEITGSGHQYFDNIYFEDLSEKRKYFDNQRYGVDFGTNDPNVLVCCHLDFDNRILYIYDSVYRRKIDIYVFADLIKEKDVGDEFVVCDSENSPAISVLSESGINAIGARKGPHSRRIGCEYLRKKFKKIIIDDNTCPEVAKEFVEFEAKVDKYGVLTDIPSDKNDHSIDAVRYALEDDITAHGIGY